MPAYLLREQSALLLGDSRHLLYGTATVDATLRRRQRLLGQQHLALETRETLVAPSGASSLSLPADHVQTFALLRGVPALSVAARVVDSGSVTWWLTVSAAGVLALMTATPTGAQLLISSTINWLRLPSPNATLWYVYPSTLGIIEISTAQPVGSGQTNAIQLRDTTGTPWYLSVSNLGELSTTMTGSATVTATALTLVPLQRMEAEARQRLDNRAATGPPRHYAIEGKRLWVDPTPDATYELEHLYFSTDTTRLRRPWETVSVLDTVAALMARKPRGGSIAAQLQGMRDQEVSILESIYVPGPRDARASLASVSR